MEKKYWCSRETERGGKGQIERERERKKERKKE